MYDNTSHQMVPPNISEKARQPIHLDKNVSFIHSLAAQPCTAKPHFPQLTDNHHLTTISHAGKTTKPSKLNPFLPYQLKNPQPIIHSSKFTPSHFPKSLVPNPLICKKESSDHKHAMLRCGFWNRT